MGDGIQAAKAGILEIGDVFVVNKADRDGADATVRDLRHMISLGDRTEPGLWRPPVVKTVAAQKAGIDEVMEALDKHRAFIEENGELAGAASAAPPTRSRRSPSRRCAARLGHLGGHHGRRWHWPATSSPGAPTRTPPPTASSSSSAPDRRVRAGWFTATPEAWRCGGSSRSALESTRTSCVARAFASARRSTERTHACRRITCSSLNR